MSNTDSNPEHPALAYNLFDPHSVSVNYPEVNKPSTTPLGSLPSLPHPKTPVMAPGDSSSSGKNHMFSSLAPFNKKSARIVKLDRIGKPSGPDNDGIWSASINIVLKGINAYELVVDGVSPADDGDQTEIDAF